MTGKESRFRGPNRALRKIIPLVVIGAFSGCDSLSGHVGYSEAKAVAETLLPAFSFAALAADGQVYYSASVDTTTISLQNLLQALNLPFNASRDASGVVRISSATPEGAKFVLVVQPGTNGASTAPATPSQTRVSIEWTNGADSAHGIQVLADLEVKRRRQP